MPDDIIPLSMLHRLSVLMTQRAIIPDCTPVLVHNNFDIHFSTTLP